MTERTAAHWGSYLVDRSPDGGLRLIDDPQDPEPSVIGRGWLSAMQDDQVRIARPAIREGWLNGDRGAGRCDDSYVEVSWDDALGHVAGELDRVRLSHGNGSIFAGSYGWASAGRFHHAQSQLRRFLNLIGGHVFAKDTYSHAAAEVLLPHLTGMSHRRFSSQMTTWARIAEHCRLFLAVGGVSARTAQISSGGTARHETDTWLNRAAANGMRIVNLSPQRSDMAGVPTAEWFPVRPGGDSALLLALAGEIVLAGREDRTFLDRCTSGWAEYRAYLMGDADGVVKDARWAAPICDLPEERIRALAMDLVGQPSMIAVNWGMQRAHHGEQPIWAGLALACVIGQIGQPGCGYGFGYGSAAHIGRAVRQPPWPAMPQGPNPVDDFIPVARIADMLLHPGESYRYNGETRRYPDARLVYWAGGNPFHHHQDLQRLERAWCRPETVIVHDHSWTATARRADIVLPSTSALEREDMMVNGRDNALIFMSRVMPRFAEARDDHEIFADLAARMGVGEAFSEGRDADGWLRWIWDGCRKVAADEGFSLPEFEAFRALGRIDLPQLVEERDSLSAFVNDPEVHPLRTESGKLTLFNHRIAAMDLDDCPGHPAWLEPVEWLGRAASDELHLISGQPMTRLHSQLDNGRVSAGAKSRGREICRLHPEVAARIGARAGDMVCLWNGRGACVAALEITSDIRPDCIALPTGAWFDPVALGDQRVEMRGNPNVLTLDRGTSGLAQGNIGHTTLVRVRRWLGQMPEVSPMRPRLRAR